MKWIANALVLGLFIAACEMTPEDVPETSSLVLNDNSRTITAEPVSGQYQTNTFVSMKTNPCVPYSCIGWSFPSTTRVYWSIYSPRTSTIWNNPLHYEVGKGQATVIEPDGTPYLCSSGAASGRWSQNGNGSGVVDFDCYVGPSPQARWHLSCWQNPSLDITVGHIDRCHYTRYAADGTVFTDQAIMPMTAQVISPVPAR